MAERPQNKHLNPTLGQQALGIVPLAEGEVSEKIRVRGPKNVVAWFAALPPAERSQVLQAAYAARPLVEEPQ